MGWTNALTETYDNYFSSADKSCQPALLSVGFIEKKVTINIYINRDSTFHSAEFFKDGETICVPTDAKAESRTGPPLPYPLCDEIRYVAGDLSEYTEENYNNYNQIYIENLSNWCEDEDAPEELRILLNYLKKNTLFGDVLPFIRGENEDDRRVADKLLKAFVNFRVYTDAEYTSLSDMKSVCVSHLNRLVARMGNIGFCYASGNIEPIPESHGKVEGNGKLFSAKDAARPFQYRGRFTDSSQACTIGYITSAKIHNTLRWLTAKQGYRRYGLTFITWCTSCGEIITAQDEELSPDEDEQAETIDTEEIYAKRIRSAMSSRGDIPEYKADSKIVMLAMQAVTPGRMSIVYYEEIDGRTYLERLSRWYESCFWRIPYFDNNQFKQTVKTPNLYELGETVFGRNAMRTANSDLRNDKSITKQIRRFTADILSCIYKGKRIPENYVYTAYHRSLNPYSFIDKNGKWQREQWNKCISVTLAMLKNGSTKEEYSLALNTNETDRSYLFGRLLAVADVVEMKAVSGTDAYFRQTTAVRFFNAMQQHPAVTWKTIENRLIPYFLKFKYQKTLNKYRSLFDEISQHFNGNEMSDNSPLSPRFLEGYHNQRYELLNNKEDKENGSTEE